MKRVCVNKWLPLTVLSLGLATAVAGATDAPVEAANNDAGKDVEKITVTGTRSELSPIRMTLDFISKMSSPVLDFGYARLERPACFKVHNAAGKVADFLEKRLTMTTQELGLKTQGAGCKPNIDIIFTDNGKRVATQMAEARKDFFKPFGNSEGTTQGMHALSDFKNSDAAVRWWQITVPMDRNGYPVVEGPNQEEVPHVAGANSNLTSGLRDQLLGTLVIVDVNKLKDASWDQLADYIAMVTLVQVDPHAPLIGFDTILNLFSGGTATALTKWDKAYLQALYAMNLYELPRTQKGDLAYRVLDNLEKQ